MISFAEAAQIVTAVAAIGAVIVSARNGKKIQEVHLSINSRMEQLLAARSALSHAQGVKQQRDDSAAALHKMAEEGQVVIPEQQLRIETPRETK